MTTNTADEKPTDMTFASKLCPLCPCLHTAIGAELNRVMGLPEAATIVRRASRAAAIQELHSAMPRRGETPVQWAKRNAVWFQCPASVEYSADFFAKVEKAGEADFQIA